MGARPGGVGPVRRGAAGRPRRLRRAGRTRAPAGRHGRRLGAVRGRPPGADPRRRPSPAEMTTDVLRAIDAYRDAHDERREAARRHLTLAVAAEVMRHDAVRARLAESDALADLAAVLCDG